MSLRFHLYSRFLILSGLLLFVLTLSSCSKQVEETCTDIPATILTENDERIPQKIIDSIFTFDRFIIPELTEQSVLGVINKVIYKDSVLFILHGNKVITSFDRNGGFLRNYSHVGQGPGEYVSIDDFDIKEDSLFILTQNNVYNYSMDDVFIKTISLPNAAKSLRILNSGIALNNGFGVGNKKTKDNFSYTYLNNGATKNHIEFNKQLLGNTFTHQGLCSKFMSDNSNDNVLTFFPYNDTIYNVDVNSGHIIPLIAIKIGDRNINKDTSTDEIAAIRASGAANSIYAPYYWDNKLMFQYIQNMPKLAVVKTDGEIILNGTIGKDSNGLPISFIDLQSDTSSKQALSVLSSTTLDAITSHITDLTEFPVLKMLSDKVSDESNPILIFYDINI